MLVPLFAFTSLSSASQAETGQPNATVLHVRLGPTWPWKGSFRENWDQTFISSSFKCPLSLFVGLDMPRSDRGWISLELGRTSYVYEPSGSVPPAMDASEVSDHGDVAIHPFLAGYRYLLGGNPAQSSWLPYVGGGLGLYWAILDVTYLVTDEFSGVIGEAHETEHYIGPGAYASLGLDRRLGASSSAGVQARFDLNHLGAADSGGLGQAGGLAILLDLSFEL